MDMYGPANHDISRFYVAGINYKKTDASVRGLFAVGAEQYDLLLSEAKTHGINELFILSTCNRTEVYGVANDPSQLIHLLCSHTAGDEKILKKKLPVIKKKKKIF